VGEEVGQDRGIIINDAVRDEPAAFLPQLLFIFGLETELPEVRIGDSTAQLMVIFPAIEGPLDVPA
jgi:hypothetical protein